MFARSFFAGMAALWVAASAAQAESLCSPPRGSVFQVTGVASNDTLNMRAGPGVENELVGLLRHNERNIRFDNDVAQTSGACRRACALATTGVKAAQIAVELECTAKARLWYKVRDADGRRGWVAAKFLRRTAGTAMPPQRPPVDDDSYRFTCDNGRDILLVVRDPTRDAILLDFRGRETVVVRERNSRQPIAYIGRDPDPDVYIRGDRREVEYSDNRGRIFDCSRSR